MQRSLFADKKVDKDRQSRVYSKLDIVINYKGDAMSYQLVFNSDITKKMSSASYPFKSQSFLKDLKNSVRYFVKSSAEVVDFNVYCYYGSSNRKIRMENLCGSLTYKEVMTEFGFAEGSIIDPRAGTKQANEAEIEKMIKKEGRCTIL